MCSLCWIFWHLSRRIIRSFYPLFNDQLISPLFNDQLLNNWSLNKGLFLSSMQKYISLICGLRTSENSAWWSRSKPDNKRCVFLALKACHELPFLFIIRPLRDCGQSFYSSFLKYSSTAGPQEQQIQLRLWQVLFCDRWWYKLAKKGYHVPSSRSSSVRFIE